VFARPDGIAEKRAYFVVGGDQGSIEEARRVCHCLVHLQPHLPTVIRLSPI
jgi:hypothetical protein